MSDFNICMYCDNMDIEDCGYACMVRSRKKEISGSRCGDFIPNELFVGVGIKLLKQIMRGESEH